MASDSQVDIEEWRAVPGLEGEYEVSNHGRVRSLDRFVMQRIGFGPAPDERRPHRWWGKLLKPGLAGNGYLTVSIKGRSLCVQYLVAAAFIGPRPKGLLVLHWDGQRTNNHDTNLRYGTKLENCADAIRHGTVHRAPGEESHFAKLKESQVREILATPKYYGRNKALAERFGVSDQTIVAVIGRKTWRHLHG